MKKKTYIGSIIIVIALLSVLIILFLNIKFPQWKDSNTSQPKTYSKHYALISEDMTTSFWQSVYESAKKEAEAYDIYLEQVGMNLSEDYSLKDYMKISIDSKVDGIIVCPDGSKEVADLIEEARDKGIPVVTVLNDELATGRVSFVGINSYELGLDYAEQILAQIKPDTENIYILLHASDEKTMNDVVYNQIKKTVNERLGRSNINIQPYFIQNNNEFDSEEAIRDIFVGSEDTPDIVVCMEEIDTECACQAVVDYNKVGEITIIGSYSSQVILEAIQKKLAALTITMDTEQLGRQCVQALHEYEEMGNVSNYFNVDLHIINEDNVKSYIHISDE